MLLTVFTPTFNRAHTIARTFNSLIQQTFKDFEWLIVDDGSTDSTEKVVEGFIESSDLNIRYIKKENGGKHTAYNLALEQAAGELFFVVDSDDWLPGNSLSDIAALSEKIMDDDSVGGVIALKMTPDGAVIGKKFRQENCFATFRQLELTGQGGERSIVFKTKITRKFPFPVIRGERFMPEGVVYDKFNQDYKFVIKNNCLTTCEYQSNGLSSAPRKLMLKYPGGYTLYYRTRIDMAVSLTERIGYIIRYNMFRNLYKGDDIAAYKGAYKNMTIVLNTLTPLIIRHYLAKL